MEGILHIIGAGPGDPELLTIKAFHVLTENTDVVAYPGSAPCTGTAFQIVSQSVPAIKDKEQLPLSFPMSEDPETLSDAHTAAVRQVKDKLTQERMYLFLPLETHLYTQQQAFSLSRSGLTVMKSGSSAVFPHFVPVRPGY